MVGVARKVAGRMLHRWGEMKTNAKRTRHGAEKERKTGSPAVNRCECGDPLARKDDLQAVEPHRIVCVVLRLLANATS